ncbi:RxLR effector protein [Phytophthora megakarya]|uniref:RxLR effector protein n=1 Tax=Phytophthora megakarya TaxID=4795 RepID=A0A225VV76_9STRA|nr:RxLR effector protein [Phytophthora megakarya]
MRFFLIPALAALAFVSTCDAAVAETNTDRALKGDITFGRSLRNNYGAELDSEDSTNSEARAISGALATALEGESRAVSVTGIYRSWYKARLTPPQVKAVLGVTTTEMTTIARKLQRFYLGYFSFYEATKKKEEEKNK